MTSITLPAAAPTAGTETLRVTQRSVVRAEWIKFRSVRANLIALASAGVLLVAFGTLFSSLAGSGEAFGPPQPGGTDSLTMSFAGINLSQLVLGVLGAVFVAGEYSTGMIRSMFAAVPGRSRVLWAKAIVLAGSAWVVMTVASFAVFFTGRAAYGGDLLYGIGDAGVLRAVAAGGVYGAGIVLLGLALGFVLRSTAATIGTLVGTLMVAPGLIGLLPDSVSGPVGKVLPSNAGQAFMSVSGSDKLLSPGAGFAVFAAWVVGLLGVALFVLKRRDA